MAVRQIRIMGDDILTKKCKPVKEMTGRTMELIEDMFETMYEANGCGLAAPQVGVLKQIVIIDVDDGNQYVMINPEIIGQEGSQTGYEGCLSLPGKSGIVTRPNYVKVKALDENMEPYELEGDVYKRQILYWNVLSTLSWEISMIILAYSWPDLAFPEFAFLAVVMYNSLEFRMN